MYREERQGVSGVPLFFEKSPLSLYFTYRNNIVTCRTATAAPNAISVLNTILNTGQPHEPVSCRIAATVTRQGAYSSTNTSRAKAVAGVQRPSLRICCSQRRGIFGIDVAEGIGRAERGDDDFLRRETAHQRDVRAPVKPGGTGQRFQRHAGGGLQTSVEVPAPRARRARP